MPTYVPTDWVDNITPVNAANMDKMEAGIAAANAGALPADTVVASPTRIISNKIAGGDAQPSWKVQGDGRIDWGPGGAVAQDTTLYRAAANELATDGFFTAFKGTSNQSKLSWNAPGQPGIFFGAAADTNLYRAAADNLMTDNSFTVGKTLVAGNGNIWFGNQFDVLLSRLGAGIFGSNQEFRVGTLNLMADGNKLWFGPSYDTNLYRASAATLKTDGVLQAAGAVVASHGQPSQVQIGGDYIWFGSAYDTNLYRSGADILKTDDAFDVNGAVKIDSGGFAGGRIQFGTGGTFDMMLERFNASTIRIPNGALRIEGAVGNNAFIARATADTGPRIAFTVGGVLSWGAGVTVADTNLYRSAANTLTTDDDLRVVGNIYAEGAANSAFIGEKKGLGGQEFALKPLGATQWRFLVDNAGSLVWGDGTNAPDVNLYRYGANLLKTDDNFVVASSVYVDYNEVGGRLYFGNAADTNLYRYGANVLMSDDQFFAAGGLVTMFVGGAPSDANIAAAMWGTILWDNGNNRLWVRGSAGWYYINTAPGF